MTTRFFTDEITQKYIEKYGKEAYVKDIEKKLKV